MRERPGRNGRDEPDWDGESAADLVAAGWQEERGGRLEVAATLFEAARSTAHRDNDLGLESEAIRGLAVATFHRGFPRRAEELAQRSLTLARAAGSPTREAEAGNTLGCLRLERGELDEARRWFDRVRVIGGLPSELTARLDQNLGIVANIQGFWELARTHYHRALAAFEQAGDVRGRAQVHHNLAMIATDHGRTAEALDHFGKGLDLAESAGAARLAGLCRLNRAEVLLTVGDRDQARDEAIAAYATFTRVGSIVDLADCCRVLGKVDWALGRVDSAEGFLRAAVDLAVRGSTPLTEGSARSDLGDLLATQDRLVEARSLYEAAGGLFAGLGAEPEVARIGERLAVLGPP